MRFRQLSLIRYGLFSERTIDLPQTDSDFHVVFGPNEAGKSTLLAAIEDLLFGIKQRTAYNFRFDNEHLRLGAELENGEPGFSFVRRKGTKQTLLAQDGSPLVKGEATLGTLLAGVDRPFYERMFCLDHLRLERGGKEILQAGNEVGQALFSAGSGITGLRERLGQLAERADKLWSPRKSKKTFYLLKEQLTQAEERLRTHTLQVRDWQTRKTQLEEAETNLARVKEEFVAVSARRDRLGRIRRVYREVRAYQDLSERLRQLGEVALLPEDARSDLQQLERQHFETAFKLETLQTRLTQETKVLATLRFDSSLLQRAEDIRRIDELRIKIQNERLDLPKRKAELKDAEKRLKQLAREELNWPQENLTALIERLRSRSSLKALNELLRQKGELKAELDNASRAVEELEAERRRLKASLAACPQTAGFDRLVNAIRTVRDRSELAGRIRAAEIEAKKRDIRWRHECDTLNPKLSDPDTLGELPVPAPATVATHQKAFEKWRRSAEEAQEQSAALQEDLARNEETLRQLEQNRALVTPEIMQRARETRDELWERIKRTLAEPATAETVRRRQTEPDYPAPQFETAMAEADSLADRRFDHAREAGRLEATRQTNAELKKRLKRCNRQREKLEREKQPLDAGWLSLWDQTPLTPLEPEAMQEWLGRRDTALRLKVERDEAWVQLNSLRRQEQEARRMLLDELQALGKGLDDPGPDSLPFVLESARDVERQLETEIRTKEQLTESVAETERESRRRANRLAAARTKMTEWNERWNRAMEQLGFPARLSPEKVEYFIETIERMRTEADNIQSLKRDRIDKITRDLTHYDAVVGKLIDSLDPELKGLEPDEAVVKIKNRLSEAQRQQERFQDREREIAGLQQEIVKRQEEHRLASRSVDRLKEQAGAANGDALREAIERSDQKRRLERKIDTVRQKLGEDGDGLSLAELEAECADFNIDQAQAQETSLDAEFERLQQQFGEATEAALEANKAMQVGESDDAAQAAAQRQSALGEIQECAERYVHLRTATLMLQWAIDYYRQEKQAPMLQQAGQIFQILTGGSFAKLEVTYDAKDQAQLNGRRSDDQIVPIAGLSSGTTDQLYLALRIAAVENYLKDSNPLPFVADDLFINFDDCRSAEGFRLLRQLAKRVQVFYFTHHAHMVDIARRTLGASAHVVTIGSETETLALK